MSKLKYITLGIIVIAVTATLFFSCDSSVQFVPIKPDTSPMWPQQGYSARRTGNPYGPKQIIVPIISNSINWVDTLIFGINTVYPTIDSKGNIYYLLVHPDNITATLFKIDILGNIVWQLTDSSIVPSFGNGLGLSKDEKNIYIPCYSGLFCVDSSGSLKWKHIEYSIYSNISMPAIGEDGTVYSVIGAYFLQAFSSDGSFKWKVPNAVGSPSIDKDGNVYIGWTDGQIGSQNKGIAKYDKNGNIKWKYDIVKPPFGISIDGNNNIYCQTGNTLETGILSLSKDGTLRWKKFFSLGDSTFYNFFVTPILSYDNILFASGGWIENSNTYRGIIKMDTLGNIYNKIQIGSSLEFNPIDELLFDSNGNIYFRSEYEYGSVNSVGIIRFLENKAISNLTLSIEGKLLFATHSENNSIIVTIK